mmetsp:Transcript_15193/g.20740  ORF Transcript_15193/g.20740 Transcript_15193/m.20740 type:complete len:125 (-) Transcript_15193:416-790(-)
MEPNAATPRPEYNSHMPPFRLQITDTASINPKASPEPLYFCCTVLMVSNGANNALEHAAANPEARLFFKPSVTADEEDDDDGDDEDLSPPRVFIEIDPIGLIRCEVDEAIVLLLLCLCLSIVGW